jgi:hypothetical protein
VADSTIVFLVLGVLVVLLIVDVFPTEIVAMASALVLWATGVLDVEQTLAGFGNPTVIFVASLLVVAAALDASGVTAWAGQILVAIAGDHQRRLTIAAMGLGALLTSLITVNGAVAALIPVVVATAIRVGVPTSKLLLPLALAAHAGSQLTLTGSQSTSCTPKQPATPAPATSATSSTPSSVCLSSWELSRSSPRSARDCSRSERLRTHLPTTGTRLAFSPSTMTSTSRSAAHCSTGEPAQPKSSSLRDRL